MSRNILASVAAVALLAGFAASSASAAQLGFYVGVNGSATKKDTDAFNASTADAIYANFSDPTLQFGPDIVRTSGTFSTDGEDTVYGFLGGWRWRPNIAFELSYMDLGDSQYRSNDTVDITFLGLPPNATVPVPVTQSDISRTHLRAETTGIGLSALGIWPISYRFEAYARGGVLFATNHITESVDTDNSGSASVSGSKSSTDFLAGVGFSMSFLSIYQARLEYTRIFKAGDGNFVPEADVDMFSIGFTVTF